MQQLAILENAPRRQLDNQDDIQRLVDYDEHEEQKELKNKIVFSIQGLGGIRTIKRQDKMLEAYIKGPHCEESVRDLVKFIRQDSPFNPKTRLILADYNIVQSDLLKLLPLQIQDKKLSFWIIALLALMTTKPSQELNADESNKLYDSLRTYKQSFIDRECFETLVLHLAQYYRTPEQNRTRAHHQMQEFLILLLRNLAQIPNSEKQPNLHNHFLAAFLKEEIMNPILYILQKDCTSFRNKIDIPLLEILYYTFTCFDPDLVYPSKNKSLLAASLICKRREVPLQTRHSRFLPHFKMTSQTGVKRLTYKLEEKEKDKAPIQGQRKIPQRMTDYKKVIKLQLDKFGSDFMTLHTESEGTSQSLGSVVMSLTEEFLELEFEMIIKMVFEDIFRESAKVNDSNIMQYLLLCSWALQMVRARYHYQRQQAQGELQKGQIRLQLSWIVEVMQNAHFELIYKLLFREVTREKKKQFKINIFNSALKLFDSYLDVIKDLSSSMNVSDRKNSEVLMSNIFRHDIARILRTGFSLVSHEGITSTLIKVTYKFFKLLSIYSDGKVLTIKTNRLLKRKKKHYSDDEDQLEQYREQDLEQEEPEKHHAMKEDEGRFQERKYNEKSQFAIVAEYSIISKYMTFLHHERFLENQEDLNEAIFFYFIQIKKLLNGEWLFFQADTICTFQSILSNQQWVRKNKTVKAFVSGVCMTFIKLLRKNPLALVESLFRYNNLTLKEQILKNYSEEYQQDGQHEENMFTDQ